MLPTIINDHSPMDDYKKIQSQIKYTVQYASCADMTTYGATIKPDCKEKLTGNGLYKIAYRFIMLLLILTGIGTIVSIIAGIVFSHDSNSEFKRRFFIVLIIATCAAFLLALLISEIATSIELHAEKKDRKTSISLDSKTWILNNEQIVVSDEQKIRSAQQYDRRTRLPISDVPFKKLIIIQKVYAITRADGRIIVDADITELFRKHPNLEEGYADGFYYYCRRDKRDKVMWYEDMYGRELLLLALQQLIQS